MDGAARAWTARPTAWPPAGGPSRRRSTRRRVGGEGAVPFAPPPLPAVLMGKQQRSLPPSHAVTGASPARAREKVVILDCLSEPPATHAWRPPQRVAGGCLRTSRVDAGAQSTGVARVSRRRQPPWRLGRCHRDRRDAAYVAIFINARATRSGCPELSKSRRSPWCAEGKPNPFVSAGESRYSELLRTFLRRTSPSPPVPQWQCLRTDPRQAGHSRRTGIRIPYALCSDAHDFQHAVPAQPRASPPPAQWVPPPAIGPRDPTPRATARRPRRHSPCAHPAC